MASAITTHSTCRCSSLLTLELTNRFFFVFPFSSDLGADMMRAPGYQLTYVQFSLTKYIICHVGITTGGSCSITDSSATTSFDMEALPPTLTSACEQPPLYDGTTRLYMSYVCPYAQRVWITRNYKGLKEEIELVPMDTADKPAWYKEVYPPNQLPSLEHNKKIIGESLDLIKYIDSNFNGPKLITDDPEKQRFAEELLGYSDAFNRAMLDTLRFKGPVTAEAVAALDKIDSSLSKFEDGPFFLGQFSLVDIAYVPFIDGFQIFFASIKNYDIAKGRVHIRNFIEELNKIDAYTQTKQDPEVLLSLTKKKLAI